MANTPELIKQRTGNPYDVWTAIERAASDAEAPLTDEELFLCRWFGLYPHRLEKGYFMLRTRQPNGLVTPEQLRAIADIAEQHGQGYADLTTRQDIQLHWIRMRDVVSVIERLKAVGVETLGTCGDVARNVVGCPVAGVGNEELVDAEPVVRAVTELLVGVREYANLPHKYKIGITGCRTQCIKPEIQCVSLVGTTRTLDGRAEGGFDLRVGGGLSTQPFISQRVNAFIRPAEAADVIRCITEIWRDTPAYREKRHRSRLKYLIHDWGMDRFREVLQQRLGRRLEEGPDAVLERSDAYHDHIGVHAQRDAGRYYVGAPVLVGRITSQQIKRVADLSERYGDGRTIRLTVSQNLLLLNIQEASVEKVLAGLADAGLSINAHPVRRSVVTCTGTQFCKLAITETKARSRQIVTYLEDRVQMDEPLRLNISGCPNACAQHQIGHIGMMGSKTTVDGQIIDAYDIFVGGRLGRDAAFNHAVLRKVPANECAKRLEWLLLGYAKQRRDGESFNDWSGRIGDEEVVKLLTGGLGHPLAQPDETAPPDAIAPGVTRLRTAPPRDSGVVAEGRTPSRPAFRVLHDGGRSRSAGGRQTDGRSP